MNFLHLWKREKKKYCVTKNSLHCSLQNNLQHSLHNSLQHSQIMSMALMSLLSLQLVYFLHITLPSLKNSSMKWKINHQNDVICFRKNMRWWVALIEKKSIEDSIKDGLIISITTEIFYVLKTANLKTPKASLDAMDIMKCAGGIVGGILSKTMQSTKKWTNEWSNQKFYGPLKGNKITWHHLLRRKMAQTKGKNCLPLGQRHFSHIFHTDLGQSSALYNVRQPVITTRIYVLHKITIALKFMSYINSNLPIPAKKLQTPG